MQTKVLHGEGKPRIIIQNSQAVYTGTIAAMLTDYTVQLSDNPVLTDAVLNLQVTAKNAADEDTTGKIIAYNNASYSITVDAWDNMIPAATKALTIKNKVIDLPYCQNNLVEEFSIDAYPTKKLYLNGRQIIKIRGFYYACTLDYSQYISLETIKLLQDLYDASRSNPVILIPRRDNPSVKYECEIDPSAALKLAQLKFHQGHKGVLIRLVCLNRLTKPDLLSSLYDLPGEQNIIMTEFQQG